MKYDYKKLTPFKMQCLTNFPFIDEDFDALTNYGLLCKIVEYVNNISTNNNLLIDNINDLNNWFNNLDVTDEINNKLDEMVNDGTLKNIINNELFSTLNDKINANENNINTLNDKINGFNKLKNKRFIMIGDSYVTGTLNGVQYSTDGWAKRIKDLLGLSDNNCYIFGDGGSGFTSNGHLGFNFISLLTSNLGNILNKDTIDYVIVCGGYNDRNSTVELIEEKINDLSNAVKVNFPNANLYIGCISSNSEYGTNGTADRKKINQISLVAYKNCIKYDAYYLNGVESILKDYSLMGTDYFHPSINGYNELSYGIIQSLITGYYSKITNFEEINIVSLNNPVTLSGFTKLNKITDNELIIILNGNMIFENTIQYTSPIHHELCKIESDFIRTKFDNDMWFTDAYIVDNTSGKPLRGIVYLDASNTLKLRIHETPSGVTSGNNLSFRICSRFNIND